MLLPVWFLWLMAVIIVLVIGSFISMLVYRYPRMLLKDWQAQCLDMQKNYPETIAAPFNLAWPGSFCPHCQHAIAWYDNIPLLGFLWQRGRCRHCREAISWRYPLTELVCVVLSLAVVYVFGWHWTTLPMLAFTWILLALSIIDIDYQFIPDPLTLGLLWLGLAFNSFHLFCPLSMAVWGAIVGYVGLWLVMTIYRLCTKKIGMGHGDFKLLAALGAWLGFDYLLAITLIAAILGSIVGLSLLAMKRIHKQQHLPFGPFLAFAGWLVFMLTSVPSIRGWLSW